MFQSPLFWRLAASHVGLVLLTATLPALWGATVGAAFILAALTGVLILIARLVQRVRTLSAAAAAANDRDAAPRHSADELTALACSVDALIQRLQQEPDRPRPETTPPPAGADARGDFLAVLNHEIRTPLNGIMGMTQLALQTPLSAEQRQYLDIVQSSANFLLAVVSDLHDFHRIEAGTLQLARARFALGATVDDAVKMLSLRARQKGLDLQLQVVADVPDTLEGDPDRLCQLLLNLAGNAIQFTERGAVVIQISRQEKGEATGGVSSAAVLPSDVCVLHFEVRDTGIGIPAEKQATLFQASSLSRPAPGLPGGGVGLTIARSLVERMGGWIWVESAVGGGSVFHFTARFRLIEAEGERAAPTVAPSAAPQSLHVLLVDADMVHRRLAVVLLEKLGHQVSPAATGAEAIAVVEQQAIDLVLLDVQRDGLQTALAIREREKGTGRRLPIIATIAYGAAVERDRWQAVGIDSYLSKPLQIQELGRAIDSVLRSPAGDYQL